MELNELNGFDEDRNPITIKLPIHRVVTQALLKLDYSNGAISNSDARNQLANQFCLSDEQRLAIQENGVNLWGQRVNGAIVALVNGNKLVQPKPATIISTEALKVTVSLFLEKLGYESAEIDVVENHSETPFSIYIDIETKSLKFGVACDPLNVSAGT